MQYYIRRETLERHYASSAGHHLDLVNKELSAKLAKFETSLKALDLTALSSKGNQADKANGTSGQESPLEAVQNQTCEHIVTSSVQEVTDKIERLESSLMSLVQDTALIARSHDQLKQVSHSSLA